jgi:hypothetical protein
MLPSILLALAASVSASASASALDAGTHRELLLQGRPQVGLWKALTAKAARDHGHQQDQDHSQVTFSSDSKKPKYKAHCFSQPISHFEDVNGTFCHRYWADARYYKEGGPVFLLDGGETSAEDR